MFRGATALNLDGKGRMAMPTRYREEILELSEGKLVVTVDKEKCLLLYPLPEWERIEAQLIKFSSFNKRLRKLQRLYLGHATEVEMDASGRILLPSLLRGFAGLDKHIVLVGQGKKFELWDEAVWNAETADCLNESDDDDDDELPPELQNFAL
ncbi:MAG: division/cell wall cluster transcriptional repressor MraZ [Gammaproteobacteria bacterium]|nr:division/cell wall cluster transcriptional repressor MraZ [Gammaproteobacteria bacterium]MDH5728099.1 division/cell wall cluster transcriptional repressor MraZ [Gammaproteobacteria bacterium]